MAIVCLGRLGYLHAIQAVRRIPEHQTDLRAALVAEFLGELPYTDLSIWIGYLHACR